MAINPEDVKLYESQRLTDEDDGGGRATGNEVVDGTINNLFKDISRLDRTVGDVALRKAFVGVDTPNQDDYLGAHAIIVDPPADGNVSVVMFDAGSENDEREDAQQRIESYVVRGASAQFYLMGNQYEGQRQIVCFQREEQPVPEVGEVYLLDDNSGAFNNPEQYIRITEVDEDIQTFAALIGNSVVEFQRRRLDIGISAPLDETFAGGQPSPTGISGSHGDIYQTEVADAARYWGVSRAADPVAESDLMVKVHDIYAPLVPSAQSETPVLDADMSQIRKDVRPARADAITEPSSALYLNSSEIRLVLNRPAVRGSVALTLGGSLYDDDGSGVLTRTSGTNPFTNLEVDYNTGEITAVRDSGSGSGTISGSASYIPGAPFGGQLVSLPIPVNISNRGYNWIQPFAESKPRPGTAQVSYMALGKWYTVYDNGTGVMEGVGTGNVDFISGTINITTEALPDVDSVMIWSFIVDEENEVEDIVANLTNTGGEILCPIEKGAKAGTVVVTYYVGGLPRTLDDSGSLGILAGDEGSGVVDYAAGTISFVPDVLPDDGSNITVDFDWAANDQYIISNPSFTDGVISGTIPNAPLEPGSIEIGTVAVYDTARYKRSKSRWHTMKDDGAGGWLYGQNSSLKGQPGTGVINYATGAFSVELLHSFVQYAYTYSFTQTSSNGQTTYTTTRGYGGEAVRERHSGDVIVDYQSASPSVQSGQTITPLNSISFNLEEGAAENSNPIIPGSLLFDFGGKRYFDRDGTIYTDFDPETGAGTAVGSIEYDEKEVQLDNWLEGAVPGVDIVAGLTASANSYVNRMVFRTPGAPVRPQSLSFFITDADGNLISEQAEVDGTISGPSVSGNINVETGVVDLDFTDGQDPVFVWPDTGKYNAVLYTFLPLDAELIGLNPVRLPSDGRVPVFREGDVIVLSNTQQTAEPSPTAGKVVNLAREYLAGVEIKGANGYVLRSDQYTVDKLLGTVTFADPLSLVDAAANVLTTPLTIEDRVEHMSVINDVQITGELSFISPSGHAFPADDTVVSSAKVWGDINSRYYNFFTQKTWYGDYRDNRVGDDTTANYNEVDNPIEIANNGSVTERWVIKFKSSTSFDVIGETLGLIYSGTTSVDVAPNNPNTGNPYFIMRAAGFGGGWASGNCIRFDTDGCLAPVWIARTVLSGAAEQDDDKFIFQVRGDAD